MPRVTLNYAVLDCEDTVHLFAKDVDLPEFPTVMHTIRDPGMPVAFNTPVSVNDNENMVARAVLGTDGTRAADLFSGRDGSMTAAELTVIYGKNGWRYVRQLKNAITDIKEEEAAGAGEEGDAG